MQSPLIQLIIVQFKTFAREPEVIFWSLLFPILMAWGLGMAFNKENESVIIPAVYDTIFNFDSTGQVCMACYKVKSASASKFIKVMTTTYVCRYLN